MNVTFTKKEACKILKRLLEDMMSEYPRFKDVPIQVEIEGE